MGKGPGNNTSELVAAVYGCCVLGPGVGTWVYTTMLEWPRPQKGDMASLKSPRKWARLKVPRDRAEDLSEGRWVLLPSLATPGRGSFNFDCVT